MNGTLRKLLGVCLTLMMLVPMAQGVAEQRCAAAGPVAASRVAASRVMADAAGNAKAARSSSNLDAAEAQCDRPCCPMHASRRPGWKAVPRVGTVVMAFRSEASCVAAPCAAIPAFAMPASAIRPEHLSGNGVAPVEMLSPAVPIPWSLPEFRKMASPHGDPFRGNGSFAIPLRI